MRLSVFGQRLPQFQAGLLLLMFMHCAKKSAWLLHLVIGDKAPPVARDSSEVLRICNRRSYLHTGNDRPNLVLEQ